MAVVPALKKKWLFCVIAMSAALRYTTYDSYSVVTQRDDDVTPLSVKITPPPISPHAVGANTSTTNRFSHRVRPVHDRDTSNPPFYHNETTANPKNMSDANMCEVVRLIRNSRQTQQITCNNQRQDTQVTLLGNLRKEVIGDDIRVVFTPSVTPYNVTILLVLVGPVYAKSVVTKPSFARLIAWAALGNYGLVVDTRSFCVLKQDSDLSQLAIGPYEALCDDASVHSRWYANHGWKWAWTKPWTIMRLALDYQHTYGEERARKDEPVPPHYMYYVDGEAVPKGDDLEGTSLFPMFEHRRRIAESHSQSPLSYPWIFQTSTNGITDHGAKTWHSDQFILGIASPVIHRFLARWINHSDCEAWVEQGAYFIEALRTLEETAPHVHYAEEDRGQPCGRRYSPAARRGTQQWLNRSVCAGTTRARQCTWSTPTPMACAATSFDACFSDGTSSFAYLKSR